MPGSTRWLSVNTMSEDAHATSPEIASVSDEGVGEASEIDTSAAEEKSQARALIEPLPPRASFWTRIDRPFVFGLLVTLGGLAAILLGLALSNLSTVLIYIAFAL